ncbi:MAG: hypothetical protein WKG00_04380 [Polyangiaceae bacterium]
MRSDDATTTRPLPSRRAILGGAAALASSALLGGCTPGVLAGPEAIKLNTTPNAANPRSLNLRRNATETIAIPEWTTASSEAWQAPVAYNLAAVGTSAVTIKAKLRAFEVFEDGTNAPWTGQAPVRAVGGGILGDLDEVRVDFVDGVSTPEYISFTAAGHSLGSSGVRGVAMEDIVWTWQVQRPGDVVLVDVGSTHHRVYSVYRKPREPWDNTPGSAQNAWTEALDLACSIGGGVGMSDDLDEICCALAGLFNAGGGFCDTVNGSPSTTAGALMYDTAATSPHYSWSTHVELGAFLERCRGGAGNGPLVNCSDCAALFSTLANLLGANLWQGQVFTGLVMPVMPIGCGQWWQPSTGYVSASGVHPSRTLAFHEIAWKGDVLLGNLVWDVCYLVNGVADPANPNAGHPSTRIIAYPWGIPFSGAAGALDYREMLSDPGNVVNCVPDVPSKVRRIPI